MHLDAGQQVWLITATPYELAATIARRLGLTGALGTVAESVDGVFTGRLVGDILHGTGKAHAVRSLASGRSQPQTLHRVFRQLQRRAMLSLVAPPSPSTRIRDCAAWPANGDGKFGISAPRARPLGSGCRRPWRWARPAARWRLWRPDDNHADKLRR
ncbi:putative hydrolase [Mycobacterium kansasii]|uniref:Putative hydrolase n=1 Tax=Mycobacterium kansasii TaxID=1768 RepID=A0A1V3WKV5_MYCKA|nr:putative hydrolase [Mycobacterium kansasii]